MRLILDYVLDEVIGEGTDTVVHRARRLPSGQPVAIQVAAGHLRGDDLARVESRLRAEGRLLGRLDHPGIVPLVELVDGGLEPGAGGAPVALVYGLAEDGTVADLVARGGTPAGSQVTEWSERLTEALRGAHRAGVVHGAVSARTLLLCGDVIWLSGFGSSSSATATAVDDLAALEGLLAELAGAVDQHLTSAAAPTATVAAPQVGARALPRPLPRPMTPPTDRRAVWIGGLAVVVVVALVGIVAAWLTSGGGHQPSPSARADLAPPRPALTPDTDPQPPEAEPPCPGSDPAVAAGAVAVVGDPAGVGCTVTVVWWPDRAEADRPDSSGARTRFTLGDPGDQLLLGDWNGDGRDTPALYDPQRGELVRFDGWAELGQSLTGSVDPRPVRTGGLAGVVRRAGGDDIEVRPAPDG